MRIRLYFGHPVNTYNTELERQLLHVILIFFPAWSTENPNQEEHNRMYELWKKETGNGMDYFYEYILPRCEGGVFLPFRDGAFGTGVFEEAHILFGLRKPIWQITAERVITKINHPSLIPVLSIEETRSRIRTPSGEIVPY